MFELLSICSGRARLLLLRNVFWMQKEMGNIAEIARNLREQTAFVIPGAAYSYEFFLYIWANDFIY